MRRIITGSVSLFMVLFASVVLAHGSGKASENNIADIHQKSAVQMALESYQLGLKNLDTAASFEQKAANGSSKRKTAKYLKKAQKQYRKAKKKFAASIKYEPLLYQAHYRMGYVLHQTGDLDGALRSYDTAIGLKPMNAQIIGDRALVSCAG